MEVCQAEILVTLPKPSTAIREPMETTLSTFTGEGLLTAALFRDMSASLADDEWRSLAARLGMTRMRIGAIERDYRDEASYYMLLTWFKRVPRSSDKVLLLIHGLTKINRWDLAQELQDMQQKKRSEQRPSSKEGNRLRVEWKAENRSVWYRCRIPQGIPSRFRSNLPT